jgi:hypothetical protein
MGLSVPGRIVDDGSGGVWMEWEARWRWQMSPSFAFPAGRFEFGARAGVWSNHGWLPARTDRHSPFPEPTFSPTFLVTTAVADLRQIQVEQHSIMQAAVSGHAGWPLSSGGVPALTAASAP